MQVMHFLKELPDLKSPRSQLIVAAFAAGTWISCRCLSVPVFPFGILIPLLLVSAITDMTHRRIPNWLTYGGLLLAISGAAAASLHTEEVLRIAQVIELRDSLAGFATGFGAMLAVYLVVGVGAGDVKLAGVIGACIGVTPVLNALLWAHVLAGSAMLVWTVVRIGPARFVQMIGCRLFPASIAEPSTETAALWRYPVPMAVFIGLGTVAALLGELS